MQRMWELSHLVPGPSQWYRAGDRISAGHLAYLQSHQR